MENTKVIIQVKGGNVIAVDSNNPDLQYIIVDWDNIAIGDNFPKLNEGSLYPDTIFEDLAYHLNELEYNK